MSLMKCGRDTFIALAVATGLTAGLMTGLTQQARAEQKDANGMVPQIITEATQNGLRITGRILALAAGSGSATMSIEKSGASGKMSTSQGGMFDLQEGEHRDIATVGVSYDPADELRIELILTANGEDIGSAILELKP
jgi:hypothetical protein